MANDNKPDDMHRTGGQPGQPHGDQGPPAEHNRDKTRFEKPGTQSESRHSTNPTHPIKDKEVR